MAEADTFPLFNLPLDMLRLIAAELPQQDLGRFARVSRAAKALAESRYLSVGYLRDLSRELSGAEPPKALPDLFREAYRLGYAVWCRERDGSDRSRKAARLLRWLATFEAQEPGVARREKPQRQVLALVAPRFEEAIEALVAGWLPGEELARICQGFAKKCQELVEYGVCGHKYILGRDYRRLVNLMMATFGSERPTDEQLGILYCAWLHCQRIHLNLGRFGLVKEGEKFGNLLFYLEGGVSQWESRHPALSAGLVYYTRSLLGVSPSSPQVRYIFLGAPPV